VCSDDQIFALIEGNVLHLCVQYTVSHYIREPLLLIIPMHLAFSDVFYLALEAEYLNLEKIQTNQGYDHLHIYVKP
jgi:hypothetical protein